MHQSTTGERITAVLSTIVAIAILGAAVTAQQARTPQSDRLASLESDLRFQMDLAFRTNGAARKAHFAELDAALTAWRASARTDADNQTLAEWLRESISHTMPGADGKLPAAPDFENERPLIVRPARVPTQPAPPEPTPELADAAPASTPAVVTPPVVTRPVVTPPVANPAAPGTTQAAAPAPLPQKKPATANATPPTAPTAPLVESTVAPPEHSVAILPPAPAHTTYAEPPAPVLPNNNHPAAQSPAPPRTTHADAVPAPTAPPVAAAPVVKVNLSDLNARIAGYNQGLRGIEAEVVAVREPTAEQREAMVAQVEELASQYQFVELNYDSITEAERRQVTAPRPMADAVAMVAHYVDRRDEGGDFLADFESPAGGAPTLADRLKKVADRLHGAVAEGR